MFRNYLAAALRNLVRNKLYAAINIVGLAVGLAAALLILLFVRDEFSYDTWIPGYEQVYAVHSIQARPTTTVHSARAQVVAAALLMPYFSQISAITRFAPGSASGVKHGNIEFRETITWADPNLFEVLPLPAVAGNLATALQEPDGIVLTRSLARKYFGSDNPVGQTLEIDRKMTMRVTAVLEDLPSNTHLNLGIIASGRNAASLLTVMDSLTSSSGPLLEVFTYLRLAPGASAEDLQKALPGFVHEQPRYQSSGIPYSLELVPLAALHLHPPTNQGNTGLKPSGSPATPDSAFCIALLIVAIASINFVNLTTARAARRAVEVGMRKVSGAERRNLIVQFIGESMIYAVLGMALAILFTQLLLPSFNGFLQRTIVFDCGRDPKLLGAISIVVVAVGFLAGAYPALVLSRFSPAGVLTGRLTGRSRGGRGRQVLVALQFMILIVLALMSTTIYRQAHYVMNEALRFDKDQVLEIRILGALLDLMPCDTPFATAVRALPGVSGATCTSGSMLGGGNGDTDVTGPDGATAKPVEMLVDFDFFDLFGLKPLAGRAFSREFGGDAGRRQVDNFTAPPSVVINETLSRALGFATPASALGQAIRWRPTEPSVVSLQLMRAAPKAALPEGMSEIVGVVPDFSRGSVRQGIEPAIFWVNSVGYGRLNVKLRANQVPETLKAIDQLWKQVGLPGPINRIFLDQQIEDMYRDFTILNQAMAAFAAVAVFVACLGLFGLATFAAESRTKEIGVRKALGAGRADVLRLMLWEFNKPVLWASLIAWPVAYFIMRRWLEGFAVRVDVGLWMFPIASVLAFLIAILTVAGHAFLVARAGPVAALRYE